MTTLTPPTAFFIGAFEVPAHIVTPAEVEEQRRQQEEQAAKEARSKELKKARYEKRKAEKREFTARKKAGLLTPEELEAEEKRLAHSREWQKEWREKRKAAEPPKPPRNPGRKCMRKPSLETRKRWNAMRITLSQGGNHTTGKNRKRSEPHKD